jgi:hypothetical protein
LGFSTPKIPPLKSQVPRVKKKWKERAVKKDNWREIIRAIMDGSGARTRITGTTAKISWDVGKHPALLIGGKWHRSKAISTGVGINTNEKIWHAMQPTTTGMERISR